MKQIFFFLVIFLPAIALSQTKGDNAIIITGVTYSDIVKGLADQGFFFQTKDEETQTAITIPRNLPGKYSWHNAIKLTVEIHVKDTAAFIRGVYDVPGMQQSPAQWRGVNNSMDKQAFSWLTEICKALKPEINYTVAN